LVGGLDTVIDRSTRSSAFTDGPRSPRDVAASEHDRPVPEGAPRHTSPTNVFAEPDRIDRMASPGTDNWRSRWRDLIGRLRHRLEADDDRA
jgi:hypothetical protein